MRTRSIVSLAAIGLILGAALKANSARAQGDRLVSFRDLTPAEHRSEAFVLTSAQAVRIDAVAAEPRQERRNRREDWFTGDEDERDTWPAAAWIIDARTRAVVWDVRTARTERERNGVRRFSGTVQLPAGTYIAHYASYVATSTSFSGNFNVGALLRGFRNRRDVRYSGPYVDDGSYRDFDLGIRAEGRRATARELAEIERERNAGVVLHLEADSGGMSVRQGFELQRPVAVEITAIGELMKSGAYDYAWIQNADTRERVWEMTFDDSRDAGGAHKNRVANETLRLAAGRYVAYYVADDSHDPNEWNAVPPYDPAQWGLTLRVAESGDRGAVRQFAWEPVPAGQTIISMTGIGDDEMRSEGFTLRRPMGVRIYALGEGGESEMYDYAWIVDAGTRRRVWTMRYEDTESAGGADKNRLFDGLVRLEPGSYLVYYKSDGSHSAEDWNSTPPAESRYWGISIFPASGQLDRNAIGPFERAASNAIAEIARVRNGQRSRTQFEIAGDRNVRILAVGEGDGEMYDYGWIEEAATGRVVWEMTYRTSSHAGGARKNRLFDGVIRLPAGRYVLRYQADDSHAYGDWNSEPPDDPEAWGIAILPSDR